MYPLPWQGQGHPSKQCRLRVSWLSLSWGIVTPTIPNWIKTRLQAPSLCRETDIPFHFQYYPSWDVRMIQYEKQVWGALRANSKFGLCHTPCILTLIYGYTPYINLTIIMKQKQTHKQRRFQPLRTNYATFGGGYFGSIWTSVISK